MHANASRARARNEPLARSYVTGDATTRAAADAAWTAQHQYGGALLGEHLGQLLVIGWSATLCVIIVRTRVLPRWLGVTILLRPAPPALRRPAPATRPTAAGPRSRTPHLHAATTRTACRSRPAAVD